MSVISQLDKNIWDPKQREDIEKILTYQQKQLYNLIENLDRKDKLLKIAENNILRLQKEKDKEIGVLDERLDHIDWRYDYVEKKVGSWYCVVDDKVKKYEIREEDKIKPEQFDDQIDTINKRLQLVEDKQVAFEHFYELD